MDEKHYAHPVNWTNIGDVNPERYGGIFIRWDNGTWNIITTTHYADLPDGLTENEHMFEHMFMEPSDIWKNGNPEDGFTEWAFEQLESFASLGFELIESEEELPENETYPDYMRYIVQEEKKDLIHSLAFAFSGNKSSHTTDFAEDYWTYLENQGINPEEFNE